MTTGTAHQMLSLFDFEGFSNPQSRVWNQEWLKCEKCPACGRGVDAKSPKNAKLKIGTSGAKWTDVLCDLDELVLHERVCDVLKTEHFTGYKAHPLAITEIKSRRLASVPAPPYYLIEITGRIDVDQNELDDVGGSVCPICFYRNTNSENKYRWKPKRLVPILDTWDGSDFVVMRNLRNARRFCSKRFIDLANKHKWTNFIFGEAMPGVGLWEKAPKEIDGLSYLDPLWFEKLTERVEAKHPDLFA